MIKYLSILTLGFSISVAAMAADSPLRSKQLKLASCQSIHDYLGGAGDIYENECLENNTFTVVDSGYSEDINRTTYLKVVVVSEGRECVVEHKLDATMKDNKLKYFWRSETMTCEYEGVGHALLLELSDAVDMNDNIWGGENSVFDIKMTAEEYIKKEVDMIKEDQVEYPDVSYTTGGNYALNFLMDEWSLGPCSRCMDILEKIKKSGLVVDGIVTDNGQDEDYLTTRVTIILKDRTAFYIYFGN